MRQKCYSCMRPMSSCMCCYIKPIGTHTHFVLLIHPMEYKKEKNGTGHLTRLLLKNSTKIMGLDFTNNEEVNKLLNNPDNECYILYPGNESLDLSQDNINLPKHKKQKVIFIIDGTWQCAKKMLKLSKNLHHLPKLSFNTNLISKFTIKQQPNNACLSTIESTKILIEHLVAKGIEECDTAEFLLPFEKMLEYQIDCIKNPPPNSYRSSGRGIVKPKTMYRKPNGRKLFFDLNEFKKHKFIYDAERN